MQLERVVRPGTQEVAEAEVRHARSLAPPPSAIEADDVVGKLDQSLVVCRANDGDAVLACRADEEEAHGACVLLVEPGRRLVREKERRV